MLPLIEYQYPIYYYNVDFVIKGVVVEIFGGKWHCFGYHKENFPKRTKYILEKGFPILFLFVTNIELFKKEINKIILPTINKMSVNHKGKYKIIWNNGEYLTDGDKNSVDTALKSPFMAQRNPKTGRFESIRRQI